MRSVFAMLVFVGCGGGPDPILRNAPKPDPGVVAGAAAAVAGAATLADPKSAQAKAESNKPPAEQKPVQVKENVPAAVFDRLDERQPADEPKPFVEQAPDGERQPSTTNNRKKKR